MNPGPFQSHLPYSNIVTDNGSKTEHEMATLLFTLWVELKLSTVHSHLKISFLIMSTQDLFGPDHTQSYPCLEQQLRLIRHS